MAENKPKQNIPNGWQTKQLGDLGRVSMCKRILKHQTSEQGDIPFFKIGTFGKEPDAYITKEVYEDFKSKYSFPKKGDILISASGTIGRAVVYDGRPAYYQDSNIIWIANDENTVINPYLRYLYDKVQWQTASGTIARLYNDNVRRIEIVAPEIPEQNRIVKVLETWDEAIEKFGEMIALKREVKKGLMQKLLTGELRVPGFKGEWKKAPLGDTGQVVTGSTPAKKDDENYGDTFCWATADDMKGKYVSDTLIKLSDKGKKLSRTLPAGAVMVTCIASIGKNAIAKVPLATNQQINSIITNESFSNEFIYYLLTYNKHVLESRAGAGAMRMLSKGQFMKIEFDFPAKDEQDAIAEIIATADKEIDLFEQKRRQLQDQKKYLLNNLVTGQIRTPENL